MGEILAGKRGITADTGLRLSRALGRSDMFWINLQARYDADLVRIEKSEASAARRLSRVPWNLGGGPVSIRLRSPRHCA